MREILIKILTAILTFLSFIIFILTYLIVKLLDGIGYVIRFFINLFKN